MDLETARELAKTLRDTTRGGLVLRAYVDGDDLVFTGGLYSEHRLNIAATSVTRARSHWNGYLAGYSRTTR